MTLKQVTEALVFASQKPLTPKEILAAIKSAAEDSEDSEVKTLAKAKEADILAVLGDIANELIEAGRSFHLVERANGWVMVSDPKCGLWVRQLYPESKPTRLSGPALETLAIIAYRQPIMRADIEAVRGVAVDGVVQSLLERGLIKIAGRADIPGRPLLYETTEVFLVHFGLKAIDDLPNAGELRKVSLPTAPAPEAENAENAEKTGSSGKDGSTGKPAKAAKAAKSDKSDKSEPAAPAAEPAPEPESTSPQPEPTAPAAPAPAPKPPRPPAATTSEYIAPEVQ